MSGCKRLPANNLLKIHLCGNRELIIRVRNTNPDGLDNLHCPPAISLASAALVYRGRLSAFGRGLGAGVGFSTVNARSQRRRERT
jgi:hypothetical protein